MMGVVVSVSSGVKCRMFIVVFGNVFLWVFVGVVFDCVEIFSNFVSECL